MDPVSKTIIKKKKSRYYETYIAKIIKEYTTGGITNNAKQQLNSILCMVSKLTAKITISLTEISKKKTISEKEVNNAISLIFPASILKEINDKYTNSLEKFDSVDNVKGASRQEKAGIIFPPSQTEKFLRNDGYTNLMVTNNAPICLACALEVLTRKIIDQAFTYSKENKRVRITIRDLELGVRDHEELNKFFVEHNFSFLGGGVKPFIHNSLLVKKMKKKKKVTKANLEEKKKHRFRPGTVSVREIKKYQKISNCLTFAKFPFERMVRDIIQEKSDINEEKTKISKDVFTVLQYYIEQKVVNLLRNANFAAIHANRVKLMGVDIKFVQSLMYKTVNPYQINTTNGEKCNLSYNTQEYEEEINEEGIEEKDEEEKLVDEEEELTEEEEEGFKNGSNHHIICNYNNNYN